MKVQLISLIVVLAVLAGCPDTPTETAVDVAQLHYDDQNHSQIDLEGIGVILLWSEVEPFTI